LLSLADIAKARIGDALAFNWRSGAECVTSFRASLRSRCAWVMGEDGGAKVFALRP
jgi:hypothetical protein